MAVPGFSNTLDTNRAHHVQQFLYRPAKRVRLRHGSRRERLRLAVSGKLDRVCGPLHAAAQRPLRIAQRRNRRQPDLHPPRQRSERLRPHCRKCCCCSTPSTPYPAESAAPLAARYIYHEDAPARRSSWMNDAANAWLGLPSAARHRLVIASARSTPLTTMEPAGTICISTCPSPSARVTPGHQSTYEYVDDHAGQIVGWNPVGTWTIPTTQVITSSPVTDTPTDGRWGGLPVAMHVPVGARLEPHPQRRIITPGGGGRNTVPLWELVRDGGQHSPTRLPAPSSGGTYGKLHDAIFLDDDG